MKVLPLKPRLESFLKRHNLTRHFRKQKQLLEADPRHPSLHTEILEPKHFRIFSFRVTKQYRAVFIFTTKETIEVIDVNNHYR